MRRLIFSIACLTVAAATLTPLTATAAFIATTRADCGFSSTEYGGQNASDYCSGVSSLDRTSTWSILASSSAYTIGGVDSILRASSLIDYDGLLARNDGTTSSFAAFAYAMARYSDVLYFSVDGVDARTAGYTLRTTVVVNGDLGYDINKALFADGSVANVSGFLGVSGLGSGSTGASASLLGSTSTLGLMTYETAILVNDPAGLSIALNLETNARLVNNSLASYGIGSGELLADFENTAGIRSFELIGPDGQPVDFSFTAQSGRFAFYGADTNGDGTTSVPEPGSMALLALGMAGLLVSRRWRGSNPQA